MTTMDTIIQGLLSYHQQMEERGQFSPNDLLAKMEPIYNAITPSPHKPRILISFGGGVGDLVLLSPCLREIRRIYAQAHIFLVVSPNAYELASSCPYVDEVAPFGFICNINSGTELFYIECVAFVQKYLSQPCDIAFDFASCFTGSLLSYMSGARTRFMFLPETDWYFFHNDIPYKAAQILNTELYPEKKLSPHTVDRYLAVLDNLLHYPVTNRELAVWFTDSDMDRVKPLLAAGDGQTRIAIGLGGSGNGRKSWPIENYQQLLQQIIARDDSVHFLIIGGPNEKDAGSFLAEHISPRYLTNLAGQLTFQQSSALLSLCHYYIGNDTSAMHLAAANHLPSLVVFAYAANLPPSESSVVARYAPYHVPSVIIQPDNALPECLQHLGNPVQEWLGCISEHAHCITQVTVTEMYNGYLALRKFQQEAEQ